MVNQTVNQTIIVASLDIKNLPTIPVPTPDVTAFLAATAQAALLQQIASFAEEVAADFVKDMEDQLKENFPKAEATSVKLLTWLQGNEQLLLKSTRVALYNKLAQFEIGKFQRKLPDADLAKARAYLDKAKNAS